MVEALATVFISHTSRIRQLDELRPHDSLDKHRARKVYLRALIDEFVQGLRSKGMQPWLDSDQIEPSDSIDLRICLGLAEASAAIVLVDADALHSGYMRDEVVMLGWRKLLEPDLQLFPVLLGKVSTEQFQSSPLGRAGGLAGYSAIDLRGSKSNAQLGREHGRALADLIKPSHTADPIAEHWIKDLAHLIRRAPSHRIDEAASALGMDSADWHRSRDKSLTLAAAMLYSNLVDGYNVLSLLGKYMGPDGVRLAGEHVVPLWVELSEGRNVIAVASNQVPKRTLSLGTSSLEQAEHAVLRGSAGAERVRTVRLASVFGEDPVGELVEAFTRIVIAQWGFLDDDTPEEIMLELEATQSQVFVLIAADGLRGFEAKKIVTALMQRFPGFVFVFVARQDSPYWANAKGIKVGLGESGERDRRDRRYIKMTKKLIEAQSTEMENETRERTDT